MEAHAIRSTWLSSAAIAVVTGLFLAPALADPIPAASWHFTDNAVDGIIQSNFNPNVHFALTKAGSYDLTGEYEAPAGYRFPTADEIAQVSFNLSTSFTDVIDFTPAGWDDEGCGFSAPICFGGELRNTIPALGTRWYANVGSAEYNAFRMLDFSFDINILGSSVAAFAVVPEDMDNIMHVPADLWLLDQPGSIFQSGVDDDVYFALAQPTMWDPRITYLPPENFEIMSVAQALAISSDGSPLGDNILCAAPDFDDCEIAGASRFYFRFRDSANGKPGSNVWQAMTATGFEGGQPVGAPVLTDHAGFVLQATTPNPLGPGGGGGGGGGTPGVPVPAAWLLLAPAILTLMLRRHQSRAR